MSSRILSVETISIPLLKVHLSKRKKWNAPGLLCRDWQTQIFWFGRRVGNEDSRCWSGSSGKHSPHSLEGHGGLHKKNGGRATHFWSDYCKNGKGHSAQYPTYSCKTLRCGHAKILVCAKYSAIVVINPL